MLLTQRQELRRILKQHPTCQCLNKYPNSMSVSKKRYIIFAVSILILLTAISIYIARPRYRLSPYNGDAPGTAEITVTTDKNTYDSESDTYITVVTANHGSEDFFFDRVIYLEVENDGKWYTVPTDRAYFLNFVYLRAGEEQVEHLYFSQIDLSDIKYMRDRKCRVVKNLEDDIYISEVFYIE